MAGSTPIGSVRPVAPGPGARPRVAFGPVMPGWGSWDWVGADVRAQLARYYDAAEFPAWEVPDCDVAVVVKHPPPGAWLAALPPRTALVYAPIDAYGDARSIDADGPWLRRCARVLVHCDRLRRYFAPYAPVESMDHHVKFAAPLRAAPRTGGDLLWAGVRTNLPPLVAWANAYGLPRPLDVLTNPEDPAHVPSAGALGFRDGLPVRVHAWSPGRHVALAAGAAGFLDVKADDFRARHKPPAKGIDAIASGLPLAVEPGTSTAEHLARMGFEACSPLDTARWLSYDYGEETIRFGAALRELLSLERIGRRYRRILDDVLAEVGGAARHGEA